MNISLASKFVSRHGTVPALECIALKDGYLYSSDLECWYREKISSDINFCVNAKDMDSIYSKGKYDLSLKGNSLDIFSEKESFKLKGFDSAEYPNYPEANFDTTFGIDSSELLEAIEMVDYCVTEKNFSPVLTGVYMYSSGDKVVFVGTDSFRLAEYKIDKQTSEFKTIIPIKHINKIKSFLKSIDSEVSVGISGNLITIGDGEKDILFNLIQGVFPDYDQEAIIPVNHDTKLSYNSEELIDAVKKATLLTKESNNYIRMEQGKLVSGETDRGDIEILIDHEGELEGGVGINAKFLIEGKYGENIELGMGGDKPIVYRNGSYTYVIRPLVK